MAWNDRVRELAYTSPSGVRFTPTYENVAKTVEKKTTGFEFPDVDGTYVQDLGHTGNRYPLRMFFWGDNHDLEATAFEQGLLERGIGKLEHPLYGVRDVVPFGRISRRDNLKDGANESIVDVVFWETTGIVYPIAQADPASAVISAVSDFNTALSDEFGITVDLDTAIERVSFRNRYDSLLGSVQSVLGPIADVQDDVRSQFNSIVDSVNNGFDVLISEPVALAFQTLRLIQAPARVAADISARLSGYRDLIQTVTTGEGATRTPSRNSTSSNAFRVDDLNASAYVTGSVLSAVNNQFSTKSEALEAADELITQFNDVVEWRDANFNSLDVIDTGAAYQQLQEAVALCAGFLVQISFSLLQERSIVLDRDRTIIDVAAELYGTVDDRLDFLINSNDLSGSEILELQRGREIVYYV